MLYIYKFSSTSQPETHPWQTRCGAAVAGPLVLVREARVHLVAWPQVHANAEIVLLVAAGRDKLARGDRVQLLF